MFRYSSAAASIVICLIASGFAHAQDRKSVAVLPLVPQRVAADIVAILDELLVTEVHGKSGFRTIGSSDINSMLGLDKMKSALGCDDVSCAAEVGGALGVDMILSGTVSRLGSELIITLKIIDIGKAELKDRISLRIPDKETEYAAGMSLAVRQLLHLEEAPPTAAPAAVAEAKPAPLAATTPTAETPKPIEEKVAGTPDAKAELHQHFTLGFGYRESRLTLATVVPTAGLAMQAPPEKIPGRLLSGMFEYRLSYLGFLSTRVRAIVGGRDLDLKLPGWDGIGSFTFGIGVAEEAYWRLWESSSALPLTNGAIELFVAGGIEKYLTADNVPTPLVVGGAFGARIFWLTVEFNLGNSIGKYEPRAKTSTNSSFANRGIDSISYDNTFPTLGATVGVELSF